jgi:hypothetical protein
MVYIFIINMYLLYKICRHWNLDQVLVQTQSWIGTHLAYPSYDPNTVPTQVWEKTECSDDNLAHEIEACQTITFSYFHFSLGCMIPSQGTIVFPYPRSIWGQASHEYFPFGFKIEHTQLQKVTKTQPPRGKTPHIQGFERQTHHFPADVFVTS